jgi:hypothetical protein
VQPGEGVDPARGITGEVDKPCAMAFRERSADASSPASRGADQDGIHRR